MFFFSSFFSLSPHSHWTLLSLKRRPQRINWRQHRSDQSRRRSELTSLAFWMPVGIRSVSARPDLACNRMYFRTFVARRIEPWRHRSGAKRLGWSVPIFVRVEGLWLLVCYICVGGRVRKEREDRREWGRKREEKKNVNVVFFVGNYFYSYGYHIFILLIKLGNQT